MNKRNLEQYAANYAAQDYEKYQVRYRRRIVIESLSRFNHGAVLEIGCGLLPIFVDFHDFQSLIVLEPAKAFYDKAVEQLARLKIKNVSILNTDLENFAPKNVDCDFILVSSLLHEVQDPAGFLYALRQMMPKKAVVHINVPNAKSFHRLLALEMGLIDSVFQPSQSNITFQQANVFDIESLMKLVKDAGYEVIDFGSYAFKPFTHRQMQKIVDSQIISESVLEGLSKMHKYFPDNGSEIFINCKACE